jgi:hypothetical protein
MATPVLPREALGEAYTAEYEKFRKLYGAVQAFY